MSPTSLSPFFNLRELRKTSYIGQYDISYIILYKNTYKTLGVNMNNYIDLYMKVYTVERNLTYIDRNMSIFNIGSYDYNIDQYMLTYFNHICFHISVIIRPQHNMLNIYRSI